MLQVLLHTMVPLPALRNADRLAREVESEGIEGAVVECGVWRGGCAAVLAEAVRQTGGHRKLWLFDSFEGLPEPTGADGPDAARYAGGKTDGKLSPIGRLLARREDVEGLLFRHLRLPREQIEIRPGWFQETLPAARDKIGPIAILRLDADWYESTRVCLEALYGQVAPGGFVIVDDYDFWEGCRKATDEFLARRGLSVEWHSIDSAGRYFRTPV